MKSERYNSSFQLNSRNFIKYINSVFLLGGGVGVGVCFRTRSTTGQLNVQAATAENEEQYN